MARSGRSLLIIFLITITSFPTLSAQSKANQPSPVIAQNLNFGRCFQELGIEGSILIYDQNNKKFYEHNTFRNSTAFYPASTFKILNSLIALETGVIKDDVAVLTWDGIKREIPAWNRDTNLRQAFKDSTVWFYQVLARRTGHERMQKFINQVGYGNRQIGTPEQIDKFWLEGPLQITPRQQIDFLQRLYRKDLPFSLRTLDLVQDIMIFERTPNYILRGKTGWATSVKPNIGWFVGYLEQNNNVYFFATNINIQDNDDVTARIEVTRRSLKALGLL
ncbi:class D beta-lactamase [Nostoc sp. FACHB-152]|uniref:class D beta-lactamase n=1 Tax=unclassified Nostoc TaxID=2593658 RepID=UPI001684ECFB|nr:MULTISPECIES: class D beta-lactamase [unclassified Nostoc]MBD2449346.1 class D beta-lactamase [Nostoc sp. FACHB-152]MBD2470486.1 class D beta-lactamase [Nostoc sp. FACHB-145]